MDAIKYCRMCVSTLNENTGSIHVFAKQEKKLDICQVVLDHFGLQVRFIFYFYDIYLILSYYSKDFRK